MPAENNLNVRNAEGNVSRQETIPGCQKGQ